MLAKMGLRHTATVLLKNSSNLKRNSKSGRIWDLSVVYGSQAIIENKITNKRKQKPSL